MAVKSNTHTSGPGAVGAARDLAEHRERVCDVKQRTKSDPLGRLLKRVAVDGNGCWVWRGWRDLDGYGRISRGRKSEGSVSTHRFAYELLKGPIPQGMQIDHLCRNRGCCNPDHLEVVTCRVNLLRGDTFQAANVAKTHCPRNHEYTPENTYITTRGGRSCRACETLRRHERAMRGGAR